MIVKSEYKVQCGYIMGHFVHSEYKIRRDVRGAKVAD